jgi:hypothetical protein
VTLRRWLAYCNPELSALITATLGTDAWVRDATLLEGLKAFAEDPAFHAKWREIKQLRKAKLAARIKVCVGWGGVGGERGGASAQRASRCGWVGVGWGVGAHGKKHSMIEHKGGQAAVHEPPSCSLENWLFTPQTIAPSPPPLLQELTGYEVSTDPMFDIQVGGWVGRLSQGRGV